MPICDLYGGYVRSVVVRDDMLYSFLKHMIQ